MNVTLSPELEQFVEGKVRSGGYRDASEVVRQALILLESQDTVEAGEARRLRSAVDAGLEQLERGDYTDYDRKGLKELGARISREGPGRSSAGRKRA